MGVLDRIGQGGQGVVYRAPGVRTAFAKSMVYKEYKKATLASLDVDALKAMPDFLESLAYRDGAELIGMAAWPCRVVEDGGVITGFVMPAIPDEFFCDFWTSNAVAPSKVMAEFQHLLNDPQIVAARLGGVGVSERQKFELLRAAASALSFLHERGVCVGDISPKNLLFSFSPVPAVYFVDCDAMRVNGVSLSHQVETPGWGVPAGEQKATVYSDRYKLGLLALRLLVGDQDVRDPARLPGAVPSWLRTVITETLTGAPEQRPVLGVWVAALDQAIPVASLQAPTAARSAPPPPPPPPPPSPPRPPAGARPPVVVIGPSSSQGSPSSATGVMTKSAQGKAVWLVVPALVIGGMLLKSALDNNTTTTSTTTTVTSTPASSPTETVTQTATQTAVQTITQTVQPTIASTTSEWPTTTTQFVMNFAAIAISPSTLDSAWARNYPSQEQAKAQAVSRCAEMASDCVAVTWSSNGGCVALAGDTYSRAYSAWYGSTLNEAETGALARIVSDNPRILTSICNS